MVAQIVKLQFKSLTIDHPFRNFTYGEHVHFAAPEVEIVEYYLGPHLGNFVPLQCLCTPDKDNNQCNTQGSRHEILGPLMQSIVQLEIQNSLYLA